MWSSRPPSCHLAALAPLLLFVACEAAMLTSQTFDGMVLGFDSPGIDNRQLALNILHWLSGELD